MKMTFVRRDVAPLGNCHDCACAIADGESWWFNYRKSAVVKVLCDACHNKRVFARAMAR